MLPAARAAGATVVHCLVHRRLDGLGANHNARIFAIGRRGADIAPGSTGAALPPEFGPEPADVVLTRGHGVGPMGGTDLDAVLRNLGVSTIVAVGVSLNAGYHVVLPRDAVAGVPSEYGAAVIDNTLAMLATVTTTEDLIAAWTRA